MAFDPANRTPSAASAPAQSAPYPLPDFPPATPLGESFVNIKGFSTGNISAAAPTPPAPILTPDHPDHPAHHAFRWGVFLAFLSILAVKSGPLVGALTGDQNINAALQGGGSILGDVLQAELAAGGAQ